MSPAGSKSNSSTQTDVDQLKKLAQACTHSSSDATRLEFAACASPQVVLALIKSLEDAQASADFYRRRVDLLQYWQSKMRDPERTIACDIIANGQTLAPEHAGDRYKVPPTSGNKLNPNNIA